VNPRFPGRMPPGCWVPCRPTCRYVLRVGAGLATAQTAVTSAGADCGLRAWVLKNPGSDPVVQPGTWRSRGRKPASPGGCRRAVGLQAVPQNDLPSCAACRGGPRGRPDRGNVCRRRSALRRSGRGRAPPLQRCAVDLRNRACGRSGGTTHTVADATPRSRVGNEYGHETTPDPNLLYNRTVMWEAPRRSGPARGGDQQPGQPSMPIERPRI